MKSNSSKLDWEKLEGKKLNSFSSLSALLSPGHASKPKEQQYQKRRKKLLKELTDNGKKPFNNQKQTSKYRSPDYKPNRPYVVKPNLDAAGNYGKLIYTRPKC